MSLLSNTLTVIGLALASLLLIQFVNNPTSMEQQQHQHVIVVGGGLAGLSAALEAHNHGASVILLEKEPRLGGNSAKASSGINAVGTPAQLASSSGDSIETFVGDTMSSGGGACLPELVTTMATSSAEAVSFLTSLGVDLSVLSKCGGHKYARTHRAAPPLAGQPARNIGFEITSKLIDQVNKTQSIQIITGARVQTLLIEGSRVVGVKYTDTKSGSTHELRGPVVLSTGGFAADRKPGGLLEKYGGASLARLPTTNGPWATGDGVRLAETAGAQMILMDKVQIHPTGFVDPNDPLSPTKFLAPEALRAVGGILVNKQGRRFVDELSLRSQVAPAIFEHGFLVGAEPDGAETEKGFKAAYMLLSDEAVNNFGAAALKFYMSKGFIIKYPSLEGFTTATGVDSVTLSQTITTYNEAAASTQPDEFGKTTFPVTFDTSAALNVLIVTPSIHYTMGGARITTSATVVGADGNVIHGLYPSRYINTVKSVDVDRYAAGEASGGVHGNNRLAGNSLLECVVFGRIAGTNAASFK